MKIQIVNVCVFRNFKKDKYSLKVTVLQASQDTFVALKTMWNRAF